MSSLRDRLHNFIFPSTDISMTSYPTLVVSWASVLNVLQSEESRVEKVRHILSSGYGCDQCFIDDLREAVDLPVEDTIEGHDH